MNIHEPAQTNPCALHQKLWDDDMELEYIRISPGAYKRLAFSAKMAEELCETLGDLTQGVNNVYPDTTTWNECLDAEQLIKKFERGV